MPPLPGSGQMSVSPGLPMGAGVVDYLASVPDQRIWWVLRHEKNFTTALTGGTVDFFDAVTSSAQDGNVERAGTIPEPQIFFVFGVSLRADNRAVLADLELLMDSLYLTITINGRIEFGPLNMAHFPAGGGPTGFTTVAATTVCSNGMPSGQFINWLPLPLVEKGGEIFRYRVDIAVTLAGLGATRRVECAQHGILFRRAVSQ